MQQYHITLTKVTGMIILSQQSRATYTGTAEHLEEQYKKVLYHNLALGWWSLFSLVWNVIALVRNYKMLKSLRKLVAQKTGGPIGF